MRLKFVIFGALLTVAAPSVLSAGDPEAGKSLIAACAVCHGEDGSGTAAIYPNLGGQSERYLLRQLQLIKSGDRVAPLMTGQLDVMTEQNLSDLAAYYAGQPRDIGQAQDTEIELGESIYRGGIMGKGVAACTACHSPTGGGMALAGFPLIGGQPVDYVVGQLTAYREGERSTDEEFGGMMRQVAVGLTDGEIRAVANYIQGLH